MAHKLRRTSPGNRLERVLSALAEELIESTDEELLEAARELGMDPRMKGSSAFAGIRYPTTFRAEDFFQLPHFRPEALDSGRSPSRLPSEAKPARRKRRLKRPAKEG